MMNKLFIVTSILALTLAACANNPSAPNNHSYNQPTTTYHINPSSSTTSNNTSRSFTCVNGFQVTATNISSNQVSLAVQAGDPTANTIVLMRDNSGNYASNQGLFGSGTTAWREQDNKALLTYTLNNRVIPLGCERN